MSHMLSNDRLADTALYFTCHVAKALHLYTTTPLKSTKCGLGLLQQEKLLPRGALAYQVTRSKAYSTCAEVGKD